MNVVFMGTPQFAATILRSVAAVHEVSAVFTRPDAVRARGSRTSASPVKEAALDLGLQVFEPATLRDEAALALLESLSPDVVCVAAYGAILPERVLAVPKFGCLNVHASLLPRWRGAAPIERAILAGDDETGVCIMRMEAGLDTGAYCVRRALPTGEATALELTEALARLGAEALLGALEALEGEGLTWTEQDESLATYADKIARGELDLTPGDTCTEALRRVRASSAAHPSRAEIAGRPATVLRLAAVRDDGARELCACLGPGEVRFAAKRLFLGVADGAVELLEIKPDGKKAMSAPAFAAGIQNIKSDTLKWGAR